MTYRKIIASDQRGLRCGCPRCDVAVYLHVLWLIECLTCTATWEWGTP